MTRYAPWDRNSDCRDIHLYPQLFHNLYRGRTPSLCSKRGTTQRTWSASI